MTVIKKYGVWLFPLLVLLIQLVPIQIALLIAAIFFVLLLFCKPIRNDILLFFSFSAGFIIWDTLSNYFRTAFDNPYLSVVIVRFGLTGYLIIFGIWAAISKTDNSYFHAGKKNEIIRFPFVWSGMKEPIWRFVLIFCCICTVPIITSFFTSHIELKLLLYGLLFAVVNSILEEILWRGLILVRLIDFCTEKQALIIGALSFGLYHISLGFPIWVCFIFAIGGYYMGGTAIISKGLIAPCIMHILVNLIFVFYGVIF